MGEDGAPHHPAVAARLGSVRAAFVALFLAAAVAGCIHARIPGAETQARDAATLESAFPLLRDLHVRWFDDGEACQRLEYQRGVFARGDDPTAACWDPGPVAPMDDSAVADFERVRRALRGAGAWSAFLTYGTNGEIVSGTFSVAGGAFDRFTYYYELDGTPPEDWDADVSASDQVSGTWWFANEDWN